MLALHEKEQLLGTYRKTWVVFATTALVSLLLFIAPLILLPLLTSASGLSTVSLPRNLFVFFLILWWWVIWIVALLKFVDFYLDVFVVTNERILHIEQRGPFSRTVAELRLERVQDVVIEQHGILPTLLHFGSLRVQTAGETGSFTFVAIPHPEDAKEIVVAAHRDALRRHPHPAA